MDTVELSLKDAQKLALHHQGLLKTTPFGKGKSGTYRTLRHLGYVQIDAISVVQRAHHHTLWNRVKDYHPDFLHRLMSVERKVFEYWSHAVAFLPMDDYRFYLPHMQELSSNQKHWYTIDKKIKQQVFDRIKWEGPLFARDFEHNQKLSGQMWDYKPAKKALHELFMEGRLMISARHKFQRLYDLPERVLPADLDISIPSPRELTRFLIHKTLQAHGLAALNEMIYLRKGLRTRVNSLLEEMAEDKEINKVKLENISGKIFYTRKEYLENLPSRIVKQVHFLSPFDNAVIQRKRLSQLFGFDYQTEIYLPPANRIYGYFAMPVLWGTRFIGRINPKADRPNKTLIIRNLFIEPEVRITDQLMQALEQALLEFTRFNNCEKIILEQTNHPIVKAALPN